MAYMTTDRHHRALLLMYYDVHTWSQGVRTDHWAQTDLLALWEAVRHYGDQH